MMLKIFAKGFILNKGAYLRESWNILDFIIVVSGFFVEFTAGKGVNLSALRALRLLRALRPLRSITII